MENIETKRLAFLDEMVAYYSEDVNRRSTSENGMTCLYRSPNGNKCAIGRHIPDDKYSETFECHSIGADQILNSLPKEVQELGIEFLINIQTLHDGNSRWDIDGLSERGKKQYEYIKKRFCTIV